MDTERQCTIAESDGSGTGFERIGRLLSQVKDLDRGAAAASQREIAAELAAMRKAGVEPHDRARTTAALEEALAIAQKSRSNELLRAIHGLLADLHEQSGDYRAAIRHLRLYMAIDTELKSKELEESYRSIQAIGEIGQRITNSLDIEMVLNTVYESVSTLMDSDRFAIGLYDDAMDIVDYRLLIEGGRRLPLFQVSAEDGNSIAARAIAAGKEIVLDGASGPFTENAAMPGAAENGRRPESVVCCPLTLSDRITGVIFVQSYNANAYTGRNVETIKALASYIAIALNNSQQSEELRAKAKELELASRTDALTGLYNRRHVLEKIDEERIRFQRSARPFSIIICDIDLFKRVNDLYGHDCGDAVLKALAELLRRHIRKQDCLARWGGEEFLLLLPETNASGAAILAEKLRRRVEEYEFTYAGLKLPITMTFGVAEYLSDYGIDACIVGADSALYKGKSSGRNRVVTF